MNELNAASHRGAEADAVVSAVDVVIHGLGNGDYFDAFAVQALGIAERVVAADGHKYLDAEIFQVLQNVWCEISSLLVCFLSFRALSVAQKLGLVFCLHL